MFAQSANKVREVCRKSFFTPYYKGVTLQGGNILRRIQVCLVIDSFISIDCIPHQEAAAAC